MRSVRRQVGCASCETSADDFLTSPSDRVKLRNVDCSQSCHGYSDIFQFCRVSLRFRTRLLTAFRAQSSFCVSVSGLLLQTWVWSSSLEWSQLRHFSYFCLDKNPLLLPQHATLNCDQVHPATNTLSQKPRNNAAFISVIWTSPLQLHAVQNSSVTGVPACVARTGAVTCSSQSIGLESSGLRGGYRRPALGSLYQTSRKARKGVVTAEAS